MNHWRHFGAFDFLYTPPTFDLLHPERASSQVRTPVRRPSITNDNGIDTKPDQNDQVSGSSDQNWPSKNPKYQRTLNMLDLHG